MPNSWILYDSEIYRAIPSEELIPGIDYCKGWRDFQGMGISCIAWVCDSGSKGVLVLDIKDPPDVPPPELLAFQILVSSFDHVIGFNSRSFDDKLLRAFGVSINTSYDLLEEIRIAAFGSPEWGKTPKGFSYSLDKLARANNIAPKTLSGSLAPILWQQGQRQEVLDYCTHDVSISAEIFNLGLNGTLRDPNENDRLLSINQPTFGGKQS